MRVPFKRRAQPEVHLPEGTRIIVLGPGEREIARCDIDLAALQRQAEESAAGRGDPIRLLASSIVNLLGDVGRQLSGADVRELEKSLNKAVMSTERPETITLTSKSIKRGHGERGASSAPNAKEASRNRAGEGATERGEGATGPTEYRTPQVPPGIFERVSPYPSAAARDVYENLVGLDEVKEQLVKEALVLTSREWLDRWIRTHHRGRRVRAVTAIEKGAPFFVFAGDVGTGKTALAESFGDAIARQLDRRAWLLRMSIQARGNGIVGDMTQRIAQAFEATEKVAQTTGDVIILLLDEADALAETRETPQMHHEDRAGVNALIQGVDRLRGSGAPIVVVFCTNRLGNIDPAIRRRAMDVFEFRRPNEAQRLRQLDRLLGDLGLSDQQMHRLVELTGPRDGRNYGMSYSDVADRLVRRAVLAAIPKEPLTFEIVERVAMALIPTPPFEDER